jgi:methylenetetrahydrofolate dehydrogenase (NADP+)/methenyltetrahydrofolate cyclohydrolase
MKILDGKELAGFIKERQAHVVRGMAKKPTLLIIRDSDNPVITKYVNLKIQYGEDIGVSVIDFRAHSSDEIRTKILEANADPEIFGMILQLPILEKEKTDELTDVIAPSKDVDGLSSHGNFDSATATAINWLLSGYDIPLADSRIAIVGRGKLVGAPLFKMFSDSGFDVSLFHRGDDLTKLKEYDIIITATGVPGLISSSMIKPGATLVDAGTASEDGVLKGDASEEVRARTDLRAITPIKGGVGPLTVTCLFEHVIQAATDSSSHLERGA